MKFGYRIRPYAHDRLKWVVRGKENGKWVRKFFETKGEAETFAQVKNTELANQGTEGASLLRKIYRPGYQYKKTGVMVTELVDEGSVQMSLFEDGNLHHMKALQAAVDT
ncbi:MAG: hypothetical protein WCH43_08870, partial [Verrucomicrobiota bacterium]